MKKKPVPKVNFPEEIPRAIELALPDGLVDMPFPSDESYFWEIHPKLAGALRRIQGAWLAQEHEPDGQPVWLDDSDPDEDLPYDIEHSRSYHLFFVCPEGEAFSYETERENLVEPFGDDEAGDDEWPTEMISGSGSTGWSVAVSLLAPFAVIALGTTANYEDGSSDDPGIPTSTICKIGEQYDPEAEFRNAKGEEAFATLMKVRVRICGILSRYGIHVLPEEEWRKPVPWLRAAEEVLVGEPICVLDAFFFAML